MNKRVNLLLNRSLYNNFSILAIAISFLIEKEVQNGNCNKKATFPLTSIFIMLLYPIALRINYYRTLKSQSI